jgi:hypothetical protein
MDGEMSAEDRRVRVIEAVRSGANRPSDLRSKPRYAEASSPSIGRAPSLPDQSYIARLGAFVIRRAFRYSGLPVTSWPTQFGTFGRSYS